MYYCGLDLHAKSSTFSVLNRRGRRVAEGVVPTSRSGFKYFLDRLGDSRLRVVLESSTRTRWAAQVLERLGAEVVFEGTTLSQRIAQGPIFAEAAGRGPGTGNAALAASVLYEGIRRRRVLAFLIDFCLVVALTAVWWVVGSALSVLTFFAFWPLLPCFVAAAAGTAMPHGGWQLTFGPTEDTQPSWAPDGSRVAFYSDRSWVGHIWVVPSCGGEAIR